MIITYAHISPTLLDNGMDIFEDWRSYFPVFNTGHQSPQQQGILSYTYSDIPSSDCSGFRVASSPILLYCEGCVSVYIEAMRQERKERGVNSGMEKEKMMKRNSIKEAVACYTFQTMSEHALQDKSTTNIWFQKPT